MKTAQPTSSTCAQKRAPYLTVNPGSFPYRGLLPAGNRKRKAVTPPAHVWDKIASALDKQDQQNSRSVSMQ